MEDIDRTRKCRKCGLDFSGVRCKACLRANSARWRASDPERARESVRRCRANNPERVLQLAAEYRAKDPERNRRQVSEWAKKYPDKRNAIQQNRRARKIGGGGKLSPGLTQRLLVLQKGRCACCGASLAFGYHLDHIVPLALGGANEDRNMQLLTPACNTRKAAKDPVEFMQSKGFLL